MNQEDIILKLKNGDATIFNDMVVAWQDKVYNTAISIVYNEQDAEDVTRKVFLLLYQQIKEFRQESKLSTLL